YPPDALGELTDSGGSDHASVVEVCQEAVGRIGNDGDQEPARGLRVRQHQALGLIEPLGPVHEGLNRGEVAAGTTRDHVLAHEIPRVFEDGYQVSRNAGAHRTVAEHLGEM